MKTIIHYDKVGGLKGNIVQKAKRFNELGKVIKVKEGVFRVEHIKGYNKTDYDIVMNNGVKCNCQYFYRYGQPCSHIVAVLMFLERGLK